MGIHNFFYYFKNKFQGSFNTLKKGENLETINVDIDNFMIDLNGVYHACTQKVYKYGNHKPKTRLLRPRKKNYKSPLKLQLEVFKEVCITIEMLFDIASPKKRLILCVDGPAPLSKQNQQRQRRFKSVEEKDPEEFRIFDSNCITPGTKFMDFLSKYIDWYIRGKLSTEKKWQNIDVIFSNDKVGGEGEHKIINFIRYYGTREESYCIHGLDADLIMLSLGTHMPKFWILREDLYDDNNEFYVVDIGIARKELSKLMCWKPTEEESEEKNIAEFNPKYSVNDFIFLCFTVGNDFLPHIPSLEIIEGGIDVILDTYRESCKYYGHITEEKDDKILFVKKSLEIFLGTISGYEKKLLEDKLLNQHKFFLDSILKNNSTYTGENGWVVDLEKYKTEYYSKNFPSDVSIYQICNDYLEGMHWVISYYTRGVPDWKWCYKHHYAPFASDIAKFVLDFKFPIYKKTESSTPFQQLLSVLPPKSSNLIPEPLSNLLTDEKSPLLKFCPDKIKVDLSGKRRAWQGIVILPMVDHNLIKAEYEKYIDDVSERDKLRNRKMKSLVYFYTKHSNSVFNSYYGNITKCKVKTQFIDL